jgi:hypothetical protein
MQTTCIVNSAGIIANDDAVTAAFGQRAADPAIFVNLTDMAGNFDQFTFVCYQGASQNSQNLLLAVALVAINGGFQVSAQVDWPPPTSSDPQVDADPAQCWALSVNGQ